MMRLFRMALLGAALVAAGTTLVGCGASEPKVQMPENPTPPPGPDARLKPLAETPPVAEQPPAE